MGGTYPNTGLRLHEACRTTERDAFQENYAKKRAELRNLRAG